MPTLRNQQLIKPAKQGNSKSSLMLRVDNELRALLQALPTKADIEAMIRKIEETPLRLSDGYSGGTIPFRLYDHQGIYSLHNGTMCDCSRVSARLLRLQGLPEVTNADDLPATAVAIFHKIL